MKKILVVFGTRPEAIKMCPVVKELEKNPNDFVTEVCVSGQHQSMLQQVLDVFGVVPDYSASVMKEGQTLSELTSKLILELERIFQESKPDVVLVHGDTTTSFSAALAAFYLKIPVGHVEAGLRTRNIYSPFPEEMNRQAIDNISKYLFAPTEMSRQNLIEENKDPSSIWVTGNTVIDALQHTVNDTYFDPVFDWIAGRRMLLITAHRRENWGTPMRHMFRAIRRILDKYEDVCAVYPMHLNPRVRDIAKDEFGTCGNIRLIEPLDVVAFHNFMNKSYLILTDSGGVQEEAPSLGKPVLVMRDTTERPEGVEAGTLRLVGTDEATIYETLDLLLAHKDAYDMMSNSVNPYGDGHASERIVQILTQQLH